MSKDIRSFFTLSSKSRSEDAASSSKKTKKRILSSDDEKEETQIPKRQKHAAPKTKKKHILSDSDDDEADVKIISPKVQSSSTKVVENKKLISADSYFGNKPVKQIPAPKITSKYFGEDAALELNDDILAMIDQPVTTHSDSGENKETIGKKEKKTKTTSGHSPRASIERSNGSANKIIDSSELQTEKKKSRAASPLKSTINKIDSNHQSPPKNKSPASSSKTDISKIDEKRKDIRQIKEESSGNKIGSAATSKKTHTNTSKIVVEKSEGRKRKPSNSDKDPFEEMIEKKKQSTALYQQYLHRGGARNPGSKEIPTGAENCLAGLSFLITGVLDSLERDEAEELVKQYGGRILHQVSKKTDYVVLGDEPGPAKLAKAKNLGVPTISEDDLLDLIRTRPAGHQARQTDKLTQHKTQSTKKLKRASPEPEPLTIKVEQRATNQPEVVSKNVSLEKKVPVVSIANSESKEPSTMDHHDKMESKAWVEKYRPTSMKQIIGQQGDKSNAKKLYSWLQNWFKNHNGTVKHTKPSPWAKNDDGAFFKAALLSGSPGVGKTTTVQVVCNALGLDALEFNASDTRSKKHLKEEVSELLHNKSMKGYFIGGKHEGPGMRHVLVMDEVDGMAGNEDRGGLQELIALIKSTNIPIICICNDRNHPKMRTLSNYTFDLRFQKPRIEQIRSAMMSVCFKEDIKIAKDQLDKLIESTDHDVRQVLNQLSILARHSSGDGSSADKRISKDSRLGPWEVVRKVFTRDEHKNMTIHDKSDLFFHDYNIASLFVQENYLNVVPSGLKGIELLEAVAKSANSLAMGDLVEKSIRSNGAWSLLPMQACYSSVIPGSLMSGHISKQITFPAWLGQNSRRTKFDRLLQELTMHTRLATSASKDSINLEYLKPLRDAIARPLALDGVSGVEEALGVMNEYHLLREDLDSLIEVSLWPGQRDPMQSIDSKVKAAFTRAYNKSSLMIPYSTDSTFKKRRIETSLDDGLADLEEHEDIESDEDDQDIKTDTMIKAKKPTAKKGGAAADVNDTKAPRKGNAARTKSKAKKSK